MAPSRRAHQAPARAREWMRGPGCLELLRPRGPHVLGRLGVGIALDVPVPTRSAHQRTAMLPMPGMYLLWRRVRGAPRADVASGSGQVGTMRWLHVPSVPAHHSATLALLATAGDSCYRSCTVAGLGRSRRWRLATRESDGCHCSIASLTRTSWTGFLGTSVSCHDLARAGLSRRGRCRDLMEGLAWPLRG